MIVCRKRPNVNTRNIKNDQFTTLSRIIDISKNIILINSFVI